MITILRLGHRLGRDPRISTHVALAARALGADKIVFSGEKDGKMMESVGDVSKRWGGSFEVAYEKNWRNVIKSFRGAKAHLTVYGIPFEKKINEIRKKRNLLVIVGGEKVPGEVYELSSYNVAVTNQPHSEAAALGVFLSYLGRKKEFPKARIKVIPQERGKKTVEK